MKINFEDPKPVLEYLRLILYSAPQEEYLVFKVAKNILASAPLVNNKVKLIFCQVSVIKQQNLIKITEMEF